MTDTAPHPDNSPASGVRHVVSAEEEKGPDPRLAVVIPAKDSELMMGSLVLLSRKYAGYVIVVDDGSSDRTIEVAIHAGAIVLNAGEYGGGRVYSILAGCRRALGYGCTAVVIIDSTGKHLTRDIPQLAGPVLSGDADLVVGSRNIQGRNAIPPFRFKDGEKSSELPETGGEFHSTDPDSTFRAISVKGVTLLDPVVAKKYFPLVMDTIVRLAKNAEYRMTPGHFLSGYA